MNSTPLNPQRGPRRAPRNDWTRARHECRPTINSGPSIDRPRQARAEFCAWNGLYCIVAVCLIVSQAGCYNFVAKRREIEQNESQVDQNTNAIKREMQRRQELETPGSPPTHAPQPDQSAPGTSHQPTPKEQS